MLNVALDTVTQNSAQLATPLLSMGKIFFVKKIFVTPSDFKPQKWFLHQNGVEFNKKSKSDLTKLWLLVGR